MRDDSEHQFKRRGSSGKTSAAISIQLFLQEFLPFSVLIQLHLTYCCPDRTEHPLRSVIYIGAYTNMVLRSTLSFFIKSVRVATVKHPALPETAVLGDKVVDNALFQEIYDEYPREVLGSVFYRSVGMVLNDERRELPSPV